jgi:hypothetical protein
MKKYYPLICVNVFLHFITPLYAEPSKQCQSIPLFDKSFRPEIVKALENFDKILKDKKLDFAISMFHSAYVRKDDEKENVFRKLFQEIGSDSFQRNLAYYLPDTSEAKDINCQDSLFHPVVGPLSQVFILYHINKTPIPWKVFVILGWDTKNQEYRIAALQSQQWGLGKTPVGELHREALQWTSQKHSLEDTLYSWIQSEAVLTITQSNPYFIPKEVNLWKQEFEPLIKEYELERTSWEKIFNSINPSLKWIENYPVFSQDHKTLGVKLRRIPKEQFQNVEYLELGVPEESIEWVLRACQNFVKSLEVQYKFQIFQKVQCSIYEPLEDIKALPNKGSQTLNL